MLQANIQVPYTTRPIMTKNTGELYNRQPDLFYLQEKSRELDLLGSELYGETEDAVNNQLVQRAAKFLGLRSTDSIRDLAMHFEEDLAIMYNGKLSAICFCFPSGWRPAERLGRSLTEIHGPVADNQHLVLASEKLAKTMADPVFGSFRRQVWTVTANPRLSNHPTYRSAELPRGIRDLYFRLETQTTAPLGDGVTSLFFVRVDVVPLTSVWAAYGSQIRDSVNTMTDAVLLYKNLEHIKPILNNVQLY